MTLKTPWFIDEKDIPKEEDMPKPKEKKTINIEENLKKLPELQYKRELIDTYFSATSEMMIDMGDMITTYRGEGEETRSVCQDDFVFAQMVIIRKVLDELLERSCEDIKCKDCHSYRKRIVAPVIMAFASNNVDVDEILRDMEKDIIESIK